MAGATDTCSFIRQSVGLPPAAAPGLKDPNISCMVQNANVKLALTGESRTSAGDDDVSL